MQQIAEWCGRLYAAFLALSPTAQLFWMVGLLGALAGTVLWFAEAVARKSRAKSAERAAASIQPPTSRRGTGNVSESTSVAKSPPSNPPTDIASPIIHAQSNERDSLGYLFASYQSLDVDFTLKLAATLKNSGVRVWMDRFELKPSDDWRCELQSALDGCAGFICILSSDYLNSEYCLRELATVDDHNVRATHEARKPIIPVIVRPVANSLLPLEVRRLQYVSFYEETGEGRDWNDADLFAQQVSNLINLLGGVAARQLGAKPDVVRQYLTRFVAEMERRRGVLEFVDLGLNARDDLHPRTVNDEDDEWGFHALIRKQDDTGRIRNRALESMSDAFEVAQRFVLLGEPGSGKTTAIRHLARQFAKRRLEGDEEIPLPIFIHLAEWGSQRSAQQFVEDYCRAANLLANDPLNMLATGKAVLFFDGLNELGEGGAQKAEALSSWIGSDKGPKKIIITCRSGDYVGKVTLSGLSTIDLVRLDHARVRRFAERYLGDAAGAFLRQVSIGKSKTNKSADERGFEAIAQNPYLLSALLILFQHSPEASLPHNNGALFRRLARALAERERKRSGGDVPEFEDLERSFGRLAFSIMDEGKATSVDRQFAAKALGGPDKVRLGLHATFLAASEDGSNVRFYHQLFQEYFAAVEMLNDPNVSRFVEPYELDRQHWSASIKSHKWDEAVVALCGIHPAPATIVAHAAKSNAFLAVRCIRGGIEIAPDLLAQIAETLLQRLSEDIASLEKEADEWEQRYYSGASRMWQDTALSRRVDSARIRNATADVLSDVGPQAVPALRRALQDKSADVRSVALRAISAIDPSGNFSQLASAVRDKSKIQMEGYIYFPAEMDDALPRRADSHESVSLFAAQGLAKIGSPEALQLVRSWVVEVLKDDWGAGNTLLHAGVAVLAVLVSMFEEGDLGLQAKLSLPIAAIILEDGELLHERELANLREHSTIGAIVDICLKRFRRTPDCSDTLHGFVTHESPIVRHQAMEALGAIGDMRRGYISDEKKLEFRAANGRAMPVLLSMLDGGNPDIEVVAATALGKFDNPELVPALQSIAERGKSSNSRKLAAEALACVRKNQTPKET
jgi:HEAT repeat protein